MSTDPAEETDGPSRYRFVHNCTPQDVVALGLFSSCLWCCCTEDVLLSGSALPDPKFGHRLDIMLLMSWVRWDGGVRGDCKYEWYEAIDAPRAVRPALASAPGERALLVDRHGRRLPYHTLRRVVLRAAEAAGFGTAEARITAHVFRRSCTSELIKANANVYHVSRFLGHESLDTLQHYVRLNVTDLCKTHRETHPREKDQEERGGE